jgi:hypothetical protein
MRFELCAGSSTAAVDITVSASRAAPARHHPGLQWQWRSAISAGAAFSHLILGLKEERDGELC